MKSPYSYEIEKKLGKTKINNKQKYSFKDPNIVKLCISMSIIFYIYIFTFGKKYLKDDKEEYLYSKILMYILIGSIPLILSYYFNR
jgi:hypothetical protein